MCDHKKRARLFCVFQTCPERQCFGCSACLKTAHKKCQTDHFIEESEMSSLLTKFSSSSQARQSQKMCNLKIYKLLTRIKTELTNKIQQVIAEIMSKIKYPFLFRSQILDIYRHVRDKNYAKLQSDKLRRFYQIGKHLKNEEFAENEDIYYNEYLIETQKQLETLYSQLHSVQKTFHFTLPEDLKDVQTACLKQIQLYLKSHKTPKKHMKSGSIEKESTLLKPYVQHERNKSQFLTPLKQKGQLNVSLDFLTIKSPTTEKERNKSELSIEKQRKSLLSKSALSSREEFQMKGKALEDQMFFQNNNSRTNNSSGISSWFNESLSQKKQKSIYVYNDQPMNSIQIKISDISRETKRTDHTNKLQESIEFLNKSTEIEKKPLVLQPKKRNFKEEIQQVINERQEKIRKRLQDLKKEKQSETVKMSQEAESKVKQSKQLKMSIVTDFQGKSESKVNQKNRQAKKGSLQSPKKAENRENAKLNVNIQQRKSIKKIDNVSLNKYVGKGGEKIKQTTSNIANMKQIPLVSPSTQQTIKRTKLLKRKSTVTVDQQLQSACLYYLKAKQLKQTQKLGQFLQNYNQKCSNNLTAVEHLTYLYLQQGKAKECLNLSNEYLQKMEILQLGQSVKLNLIINKSASLNMLGRYNEAISYIVSKLQKIDHEKLHKNLGDAYFNVNTSDKAIYHYEKAIKLNDKYDQAYYNLAVLLYNQSSFFNAKMNITKAILLDYKNQYYNQLLIAINQRIKMNEEH